MTQRQAPSSPELDEKRRLVEKLKAERATKEKAIKDLEGSLVAQKQEVTAALHYLDKLAKEQQSKLDALRQSKDPKAQAMIAGLESKLALYKTVRAAAGKFEESMGTGNLKTFTATALVLRMAEGEAVVANAKLVLEDLQPSLNVLKAVLGQPVRLGPEHAPLVPPIKSRLKVNPALSQQINAAIHFFVEAEAASKQEEVNLATLRGMSGKEAVQFAANTMKISSLAGKINNLRCLHQTFSKEPLVKALFPETVEIEIPKLPPGMSPQKTQGKPLTGILMDILGIGKK